jgi:isoleucyl-tRNA synthetase
VAAAVKSVDMADICITSAIELVQQDPPNEAFRLDDPNIGVVFEKASGEKCARCWKILPDVGAHAHEAVCGRCDSALG